MPNCFQLFRKGSSDPLPLNTVVDVEIANYMNVPVDAKYWAYDWYHVIGFLIACTNDCHLGSQKLRDEVVKWCSMPGYPEGRLTDLLKILSFMEEHYTSDAWMQIGK